MDIILFTTLPQRYGHIKGTRKFEKLRKLTINRYYTPEHDNRFYKQVICFLFFFTKSLFFSLKYARSCDVVFATSSRLGTGFLGYLISKLFNKKFALDVRDVFSDSLQSISIFNNFLGSMIINCVKYIEKLIIINADWVNFVSPGFFDYPHINPKGKDIRLFTNGIDRIFIKNRKIMKSKKQNVVNSDVLNITYAGNIGYGQGLENIVIKIALYFKSKIKFSLIGDGSSVAFIEAQIKKFDVPNIVLMAPKKRNQLIEFYNNSDVLFLQLNDVDAFRKVLPSKIFEYGSFDKPILAGVGGVAKTFIEDNFKYGYIYSPNDSSGAISKIKQIFDLEKVRVDNTSFVEKYDRKIITKLMVDNFTSKFKNI